jgi:hypothetical protein
MADKNILRQALHLPDSVLTSPLALRSRQTDLNSLQLFRSHKLRRMPFLSKQSKEYFNQAIGALQPSLLKSE